MDVNESSMQLPLAAAAVLLTVLGCAACASEPAEAPEARLENAAERVENARESKQEEADDLANVLSELEEEQGDVREAEQEVQQARRQLAEANQRLEKALTRLDRKANDVAIFRSVQQSLLDEEDLAYAAISADVENRVVTLRGAVRDREDRKRALEIARTAPGVRDVQSEIAVRETEDSEAGADESQAQSGASPALGGETASRSAG